MKKTILNGMLIMSVILLGVNSVQAQNFGVRAGVNLTNFTGDLDSTETKIGMQLGVIVEFGLSEFSDLHIGALYSMKGAGLSGEDSDQKNDYFDFPVLFHANLLFDGLYVELGPNFGYLLESSFEDIDTKEFYKDFDVSGIIGAGIDLGSFRVDARYNFGLNNISTDVLTDDISIKNNAITIGFSLFLL